MVTMEQCAFGLALPSLSFGGKPDNLHGLFQPFEFMDFIYTFQCITITLKEVKISERYYFLPVKIITSDTKDSILYNIGTVHN